MNQVTQIAETFGVEWSLLGAQIISFSIVCAVLYVFAYKPVLRVLDERRQQIAQGLANTEKINAALAAIEDERRRIIAAAHSDAARLIADARAMGVRLKDRGKHLAVAAAEQILSDAREAAAKEHRRIVAEAHRDVGRLVVRTAAAVTGKILTAEDQRRLTDEIARELKAA
jgi:F-type H+-transporting ATPase subunit b